MEYEPPPDLLVEIRKKVRSTWGKGMTPANINLGSFTEGDKVWVRGSIDNAVYCYLRRNSNNAEIFEGRYLVNRWERRLLPSGWSHIAVDAADFEIIRRVLHDILSE